MARESFEDEEVAAALNRDFISVKVDREERPDVDAVYMAVCQALTGSGGWPLTVLMTPDQKPFWAGTYLPKTGGYGRIGLLELLDAVKTQWAESREKLRAAGEEIAAFIQPEAAPHKGEPGRELVQKGARLLKSSYDARFGGFGGAPKFPMPHNLLFLLRYALLEKDADSREMAEHTLSRMYRGGLFDHIGGGFSRYSTDQKWLAPHFEKMLYDNALLSYAYLEAHQITHRPLYAAVARRTLDYVLRELTHEEGGFFCGQDADSEGVEGKYYVFTPEEIKTVLGEEDGETFCRRFGVTPLGNFEGKNIPNLIDNPDYEEAPPGMEAIQKRLYDYRLTRTRLHKDDKVLTSWNSLMIAALAKAGRLLNEPRYLTAAEKARRFLEQNLTDAHGRLFLRWREGDAAHAGQLDDYAFYAFSLLELYRATFEISYLEKALLTARQMLELFFDREAGGFYLYAKDGEQLIARPKETYDGALPSGNSVAALVLTELYQLTGEEEWNEAGKKQADFLSAAMEGYPAGHSMALLAFLKMLYLSEELLCALGGEKIPEELAAFLRETPLPNLTALVKTKENEAALAALSPFTAPYPLPRQGETYYLCQNGACSAPVKTLLELKAQIE